MTLRISCSQPSQCLGVYWTYAERFTDGVLAKYLIDSFYRNIVNAVSESARVTVPSCKQKYFKFWWDEQCQLLKEQSNSTHRDWLTAGKPREGPVASAMRSAKAQYKLYLKHMRMEEHNHFIPTNDLHESLAQKDVQSFWKSFNSKLPSKNSCSKAVDGIYG